MNLVPVSYLMKHTYAALENMEYGTLHFTTPTGEKISFTGRLPGPEANFVVFEWSVLMRALRHGDIALGEDYIAQKWTTDCVDKLFSLFVLNMRHFDAFANGTPFRRLGRSLYNRFIKRNTAAAAAAITSRRITTSATTSILCGWIKA